MKPGAVDLIGQIAALKDVDYKNTLAISTLIELLVDKGLITRQEFARRALELDQATIDEVVRLRQKNRQAGVIPLHGPEQQCR